MVGHFGINLGVGYPRDLPCQLPVLLLWACSTRQPALSGLRGGQARGGSVHDEDEFQIHLTHPSHYIVSWERIHTKRSLIHYQGEVLPRQSQNGQKTAFRICTSQFCRPFLPVFDLAKSRGGGDCSPPPLEIPPSRWGVLRRRRRVHTRHLA